MEAHWRKNLWPGRKRRAGKLRYVPLEPATIKLLKPLATAGAMIPVADSTFYGMRQELCKEMRVRWPENCLRNSYDTLRKHFGVLET
jgi:hypothetical protein